MSDCPSPLIPYALGISGIYAAKLYLDIHPECGLAILDKDHYVGGTWNSSKLP